MNLRTYNSRYLLLISLISALGGYLFGFDFAVISGSLPFLRQAFGLHAWWEGFLTGSLALGCMAGCVAAGALADRYGRKPGLLLAALVFGVSSVGMALSRSLEVFICMRLLAGVGVGMASILSPVYLAEVSPAQVRGRQVSINQLTIVCGILTTNLVNYGLAGTGPEAWRWMFGLGAVPSLLFLLGILWMPESPRWLLQQGLEDRARQVLRQMGSGDLVPPEMAGSRSPAGRQPFKALLHKTVLPAVLTGCGLAVFQQFCGINVVFNYTSTLFASVGASLDQQLLEMVFIGLINLVFTLLAMWQVDKLGRRPLLLFGAAALAVLHVSLALLLGHQVSGWWLSATVLAAIGVYAFTLGPVTWVLIAEIFPNRVRGQATAAAVLCLWTAYFLLVFTFPALARYTGTSGPFWIYAGICLLGLVFIFFRVRETKGKTLEELETVYQDTPAAGRRSRSLEAR